MCWRRRAIRFGRSIFSKDLERLSGHGARGAISADLVCSAPRESVRHGSPRHRLCFSQIVLRDSVFGIQS
jgi:hypothetical protein